MKAKSRARIRSRRCATQALYQWQLNEQSAGEVLRDFADNPELENADHDYFEWLVRECVNQEKDLSVLITPCLDRPWDQIDPIERAVLFLGALELGESLDVPWKTVINEGVELCKMFGAEDSYKYINGVLDKLARELRRAEHQAS